MKKIWLIAAAALMFVSLIVSGCATGNTSDSTDNTDSSQADLLTDSESSTQGSETATDSDGIGNVSTSILSSVEGSILDVTEIFTDRDLEQTADLDDAEDIALVSGEDVLINEEGVYVLSGDVQNASVIVEADKEAKVQIVLDGVSITNDDAPAIYVKEADKVFVTTSGDNVLQVTGSYEADGDTNLDAVIYSKSDIVLNGTGTLEIVSQAGNGITSKDDLKVTGGTYFVTALMDGLEANDSISIAGGDITVVSAKDAFHSENEDDLSLGNIYIQDGTINISADDDGIRGTGIVQIDGGTINIETCTEGIEGTYIQINGGEFSIDATDDGINATAKSNSYDVVIEVNGGTIDISMASGDTDAFDSNSAIYINDGSIEVSANSAFDSSGIAQLNGGTVTVNGQEISEIVQSMMGGGMGGPGDHGGKPGR